MPINIIDRSPTADRDRHGRLGVTAEDLAARRDTLHPKSASRLPIRFCCQWSRAPQLEKRATEAARDGCGRQPQMRSPLSFKTMSWSVSLAVQRSEAPAFGRKGPTVQSEPVFWVPDRVHPVSGRVQSSASISFAIDSTLIPFGLWRPPILNTCAPQGIRSLVLEIWPSARSSSLSTAANELDSLATGNEDRWPALSDAR